MTIQEAIKKAIEGGWTKYGFPSGRKNDLRVIRSRGQFKNSALFKSPLLVYIPPYKKIPLTDILLDLKFWQCLGKALKWHTHNVKSIKGQGWWRKWHDFIDHLANGKTAEDFFKSLV